MLPLSLTYAEIAFDRPDARSASGTPGAAEALVALPFGDEGVAVPLQQLGEPGKVELWRTSGAVQRHDADGMVTAQNDSVFFGYASERVTGVDLDAVTAAMYAKLIAAARAAGFPHPLRVWHHVPQINREVEGLEQYRRFCVGRYNALERLGYRLEDDLPSASAVGAHGDRLVVYFISAREPGEQVENPRQVSAYHYPSDYGPRSPSFARATLKRWPAGHQLFVSGTASIIGHESKHETDLDAQVDETVRNLEAVCSEAGRKLARPTTLRDASAIKVYIRHPRDYERIRDRFEPSIDSAASVVYVEADICRAELLLEIEAYAEVLG